MDREFFRRPSTDVAPELLGKVLTFGETKGRIVETEAYMADEDPASHGYRGVTPRTKIMFGPPGFLYVYFTYGMHWCANVVTGNEGECSAVLIRAVEPIDGIATMRQRRPRAARDIDLTNGPAKLAQALGIDGDRNGDDVCDAGHDVCDAGARMNAKMTGVRIIDDGVAVPTQPGVSTRVGISKGQEFPWRWFVSDNRFVSKGKPS